MNNVDGGLGREWIGARGEERWLVFLFEGFRVVAVLVFVLVLDMFSGSYLFTRVPSRPI